MSKGFQKKWRTKNDKKIFQKDDEIDSRVVECGSVRSVEY